MNLSDSQRIATKLEEIGYKSAPEKEADLVVVNACSIRQHAVDRIWGGIKNWKKAGKKIIITGCVVKKDQKMLAEKDIEFIETKNFINFSIVPKMSGKTAFITIMTGCDNFCSYCAVPYTRGREASRPIDDVIADVKNAIDNGYQDILLLGQNVNSYKFGFAKLLKTIDNLPGDFSFNFMSSNPHDMTDEIIKTFSELKKWPRELHLPMQSGDDIILKKMNRKYTSAQYLKLIENLKLKIENLVLTTDIIVGFPGETKTQFNNTAKLCKKIGFKKAFIGQYSPRPGTVSSKMKDDVSKNEKKRRWLVLNKLINE